eukprot:CAMPEP_0197542036 /NCGR_PEP_ID=MMETSP1318-20131121/67490_1 /TAXON_ID=552666 /ORGANISM="Partenskyella glossopodia, Strain RCC365" /LENGTH=325 /DNA_ID=CAMNT_0043101273 /DNA_START=91 /DNA_END=1069 /DNA_ORIENTATION=-
MSSPGVAAWVPLASAAVFVASNAALALYRNAIEGRRRPLQREAPKGKKAASSSVRFRSLLANEVSSWLGHVRGCFPRAPAGYFQRHWDSEPGGVQLADVHVADVDGVGIVSSVRVLPRRIFAGLGSEVASGGIGEVSTRKEYRGKGFAGRLLRRATTRMGMSPHHDQDMHISSLHSSKYAKYYEKLGWKRARTRFMKYKVGEECKIKGLTTIVYIKNTLHTLPLNPRQKATISKIYKSYSSAMLGPHSRDQEYWDSWVWGQLGLEQNVAIILVYREHDVPCGYGFVKVEDSECIDLGEFGADRREVERDGGEECFMALLELWPQN